MVDSRLMAVEKLIDNAVAAVQGDVTDNLQQLESMTRTMCSKVGLQSLSDTVCNLFQWRRLHGKSSFARGFPGIALIAVIGRLLDPSYDPCGDFYAIHPRPLCEKYIGPCLRDKYGAPMGKSDALNVAKKGTTIDRNWATGRRPEYAALAAVAATKWSSRASAVDLEHLLQVLVWAYLCLAQVYGSELPELAAGQDLQPTWTVLQELIDMAPAGGDTAQAVVGVVLKAQHALLGNEGSLEGVGESANATNTTSKKAGDFTETFGSYLHVYEVTTKKVDDQRVRESADAIFRYIQVQEGRITKVEATFLCPDHTIELDSLDADRSLTCAGIRYHFVDLYVWLLVMLERIGSEGRASVICDLYAYASAPATKLAVKTAWASLAERAS